MTDHTPAAKYTVVFSDGAVLDYLADLTEINSGIMIFYVDKGDGPKPVAGVSAHAVHSFIVEPYEGPVFHDPAPAVHDSDSGFHESFISPGNQYVKARDVLDTREPVQDLSKPKPDPFRGGKLRK